MTTVYDCSLSRYWLSKLLFCKKIRRNYLVNRQCITYKLCKPYKPHKSTGLNGKRTKNIIVDDMVIGDK